MQKGALFGGKRHILDAVFGKDVPAEGAAQTGPCIAKAAFVAELVTLGDLGEFKERCRRAVCVEDLGTVELAVTVDRREGPAVREPPFGSQVEIVDFAI